MNYINHVIGITVAIFFAAAAYFLVFESLGRVTKSRFKAFETVSRNGRDSGSGAMKLLVAQLGAKIAPYIYINEWNKKRLNQTLRAVGINKSAEQYTSESIVECIGVVLIIVLLGMVIHPILHILAVAAGAVVYFISINSAERRLRDKRAAVEYTLPRFVTYLSQSLLNSRDLLRILESYIPSADAELAKELKILTADMKTGSYELAILRFDARLTSPSVSELARGLISVLRGDDSVFYFRMLLQQLKAEELQKLEQEALKRAPKIRRWSFAILLLMMAVYLFVLGMHAVNTASAI